MMTAGVANGGTLYEPHVVKTTIDPITKKESPVKSVVRRNDFVSAGNMAVVKLGMQDCVKYGSCRSLLSLPMTAGGKTGTAQWNSNKPNHAWFTAFAPAESPQIVVTVMIEEGEEGSRTDLPVARDFLAFWARTRY
jgi:penicillin-binding protein 2